MRNYILEYFTMLKRGEAIAGQRVHAIYNIIMEDLKSGVYFYDATKAHKVIQFIETTCRHSKGRNDLIKLEPWQKGLLAAMFGLVDDRGLRWYREIFVVIARKNGKSLLAAAIGNYMAFADGEYGGDIYMLATKLDQTKEVWQAFKQIILNEPLLLKRAEVGKGVKSVVYIPKTNTTAMPLVFNPNKSDGFNQTLTINDEVHAWEGDKGLRLYNTMQSGLGARKQPLTFNITTAGNENEGLFDNLMKRSTAFLNRDSREKRLLPFIYAVDDDREWDNIKELYKSNPNLGVSVPEEFFEREIAIAHEDHTKRREFLMKYCNVKQKAETAWLDNRLLEKSVNTMTLDDFKGTYGVGGIDLSQTTDLTAASVIIEREGVSYGFCQFFMPSERYEQAIIDDNLPYDIYVQQGIVTLSGDNHVDYRDVYNWFVKLQTEYKIYLLKIGYDRYSAQYLIADLKAFGFHMDDVFQGDNLTPIIREFEGTIKDGNFIICGDNHLLKAHFFNVALKHNNEKRTFRPVKIERRKRIDGFVSIVDALTVRHKYLSEVGEMLKNKGR
ncbi:MAG: terminase large subunit [Defluviitaleaceae bacterium]|nr:terminase large subunit [Defluviitaleaceae bacterium]